MKGERMKVDASKIIDEYMTTRYWGESWSMSEITENDAIGIIIELQIFSKPLELRYEYPNSIYPYTPHVVRKEIRSLEDNGIDSPLMVLRDLDIADAPNSDMSAKEFVRKLFTCEWYLWDTSIKEPEEYLELAIKERGEANGKNK